MSTGTPTNDSMVLLSILTDDHLRLRDLSDSQLRSELLHLLGYPGGHRGMLQSRSDAEQFFRTLCVYLIRRVDLADQQLVELLMSLPDSVSDQYRPWSPEYECPLTNREAQALLAFDSLEQARGALLAHGQDDWRSRTLADWLPSHPQDPPSLQHPNGDVDAVITQVEYDQLRARGR